MPGSEVLIPVGVGLVVLVSVIGVQRALRAVRGSKPTPKA